MKRKELYAAILAKKGMDCQINKAVEEMAEAIVAIQHFQEDRAGATWNTVITELTHVEIMLEQLKHFGEGINCKGVWEKERAKTKRRVEELL